MIAAVLAYGLLILAGYFLCPTDRKGSLETLRPFAAPAIGFAFGSAALFFNLLYSGSLHAPAAAASFAALSACLFWRRRAVPATRRFSLEPAELAVLSVSLFLFAIAFWKSPYGTGIDVWAIWKTKARFLFTDRWHDIFEPAVAYSHPMYPLLYPLMLAWGWAAGGQGTAVPFVFFAIVNLSAAGLLVSAAKKLGFRPAWAAALYLVAAPHWAGLCSSQYADAIVAYYYLAGAAFLYFALKDDLPPAALAAGLLFGAASFVKSEGNLGLAAAGLGLLAAMRREKPAQRRVLISFAAAAGFFLAVSLLFRHHAGLADEMVSRGHVDEWLARPDKAARLWEIARFFSAEILIDNHWSYQWGLLLLVYLAEVRQLKRPENLFLTVFLWANLLGYGAVYAMTRIELHRHLETSLDRCVLHLFPTAVLLGLSLLSRSAWYNGSFPEKVTS